jgi:hypothetical protein
MNATRSLHDTWRQFGRDYAVAVGLLLALAVVYVLDALGKSTPPGNRRPCEGAIVSRVAFGDKAAKPLRIAVTRPEYDNIGRMLKMLGEGYQDYKTLAYDDLLDAGKLSDYDVLFLTCGGCPKEWLEERIGASPRPGADVYRVKDEVLEKLSVALRKFVGTGGTLYASDLRFPTVANAFRDQVDSDLADAEGKPQEVVATVVNEELRQTLGSSSIQLEFDKPGWKPAAFCAGTVLLRGQFEALAGDRVESPLLIKFPYDKGTVVFTAFHNAKQDSEVVKKLLQFLVFATVTARAESAVAETMIQGGFAPSRSSILSTSSEQSLTRFYDCAREGPLQFALAFRSQAGAKLRLTVVGPDQCLIENEGTESFIIEIPHAQVGQWKCTITAVSVPFKNFPFTLTVGEKQR